MPADGSHSARLGVNANGGEQLDDSTNRTRAHEEEASSQEQQQQHQQLHSEIKVLQRYLSAISQNASARSSQSELPLQLLHQNDTSLEVASGESEASSLLLNESFITTHGSLAAPFNSTANSSPPSHTNESPLGSVALGHDCFESEGSSSASSFSSFSNCNTSDNSQLLLFGDISTRELNFSSINEVWFVKSWQEILLRVSIVAPIVLLGLIGNLTIIHWMCRFKPIRSRPTNIFILNMALADLLTSIFCPNAALLTNIFQFYVLGPFVCRFEGFVKITCLLVSAYSLIVLSFDWFLCVVKPCRRRITIRQSWLALAAIWIVSLVAASPLLYWRNLRERHWNDLVEVWCCEHIQYTKFYWVGMTLFLIYLPTFIMTIVLVVILVQMDEFEAKLKRSRRNTTTTSTAIERPSISTDLASLAPPGISSNGSSLAGGPPTLALPNGNSSSLNSSLSIGMKYRRRIVKILFLYLLTSIVCWTPLQFVIVYRHFRAEAVPANWFFELAFWSQLCASLSAALNPMIFGFLSQPFRRIVTNSWMFRFCDKFCSRSKPARNAYATNGRQRADGKPDAALARRGHANRQADKHQNAGVELQPELAVNQNNFRGAASSKRISTISSSQMPPANRQRAANAANHHHHHRHNDHRHHQHQRRLHMDNAGIINQSTNTSTTNRDLSRPKVHRSHSSGRQTSAKETDNNELSAINKQISFHKRDGTPPSSAMRSSIESGARLNGAYEEDGLHLGDYEMEVRGNVLASSDSHPY